MADASVTRHSLYSSHREAILEHVFVGELLQSLWTRGVADVEVLKPEVDAAGYDLVIECRSYLRHIQLKSSFLTAATRSVSVSARLAEKPSGCVVWVCFDEGTLQPRVFHWFGNGPGERLSSLTRYPIAKQARANSAGFKAPRLNMRRVPKTAFERVETMAEVAERMFGR